MKVKSVKFQRWARAEIANYGHTKLYSVYLYQLFAVCKFTFYFILVVLVKT